MELTSSLVSNVIDNDVSVVQNVYLIFNFIMTNVTLF